MRWSGLINEFRRFLPVSADTPVITLNEGNTPLIPLPRLGERLGLDLWAKFEGLNPTGSFKDRGMTMAVTKAVEAGAKAIVCSSTGNTSASAAAYAARAGIPCYVVIPDGAVAMGKLAQALIYGAKTIQIEGNFDDGLRLVRQLSAAHPEIALVNSVNPYRLQGQKTSALEICAALGGAPDMLAIPVGNAGNITAYWMGFREWAADQAGLLPRSSPADLAEALARPNQAPFDAHLPKLLGMQADGAAPLYYGGEVDDPHTIGTAIKIGRPATRQGAIDAARQSGGGFWNVTDAEMLAAYRLVAQLDGLFAEPASCASLAGLIKLAEAGYFEGNPAGGRIDGVPIGAPNHCGFTGAGGKPKVVAVLTGNGLKDPDRALAVSERPVKLQADFSKLEAAILGGHPAFSEDRASLAPQEKAGWKNL